MTDHKAKGIAAFGIPNVGVLLNAAYSKANDDGDDDKKDDDDKVTLSKSDFEQMKKRRDDALADRRKLQEEIDKLKGSSLSDEDRQLFEDLKKEREETKTKQMMEKGEFDKLIAAEREKHKKELDRVLGENKTLQEDAEAVTSSLLDRLDEVEITGKIRESALSRGIRNTDKVRYLDDFVKLTRDRVVRHIDEETGEHELRVLDTKSEPRYKEGNTLLDIDSYVAEEVESRAHFRIPQNGSGGRFPSRITSDGQTVNFLEKPASQNLGTLYEEEAR